MHIPISAIPDASTLRQVTAAKALRSAISLKAAAAILCLSSPTWAGEMAYNVFSADQQKIGSLLVNQQGNVLDIKYSVSNNGRGPQTSEHIELDGAGLPQKWVITGRSYAGGAVNETFRKTANLAVWEGLAESGKSTKADTAYIAAAGSPWALALYTKLAAARPDGKIDVLPAGTIRAQKRASYTMGSGVGAIEVDLYMVDGIGLNPDFLMLDRKGELFAQLDGGSLIRAGYEAEFKRLGEIYDEQRNAVQSELHAKLAHRMTMPWRVTNVRIFDPVNKSLGPISTVSVFDNRIVRVEPGRIDTVPAGEKLVDGQGGTLMPGLVDMHAHEGGWMGLNRLAAGITTVRDLGNDNERLLEKIYERRIETLDGPRIVRGGFIDGKSDNTARDGITVGSLPEGMDALHWYADHDYAYLKIYNSIDAQWVKPLADEAHRLGLKVVGHIPGFSSADAMMQAGYDEITHLNMLMLQYVIKPDEDTRTGLRLTAMHRFADLNLANDPRVKRTINLMKAENVGLDTTIAAMERLNIQRDRVTPIGDALHLDHMPIDFQRNRRRTFLDVPDKKTDQMHFKARDKLVEMTNILYKNGIKLWPGTDDGVAYTLHRELVLYQEAGIPAAEVLKIDTYDSLRYMGLGEDLGQIARGKLADFILIPGNPIEDISALRNVNLVVKEGIVYFPAEIYEQLNIIPFTPAPEFK